MILFWTLKSAPWWCTSKKIHWSVGPLLVIHQGSSCLSQSFLLSCPPWRYNELWVMILQTAGNGTQAVRGLGQAGNPWNPPMVVVFWSFPARSNGPIIWNESLFLLRNKCSSCGNKGPCHMFFMVKYLLLSWRFFPSEAISRWCQCRRLGIHPSSQIPSAAAFDASARDLREPSAASGRQPLELLGFVKIIYTPYLYTILMKMMMKHEEYTYTYIIITYIDICMYTSDFERKTAKRYCDSGWTSGCLHIFHPRWI